MLIYLEIRNSLGLILWSMSLSLDFQKDCWSPEISGMLWTSNWRKKMTKSKQFWFSASYLKSIKRACILFYCIDEVDDENFQPHFKIPLLYWWQVSSRHKSHTVPISSLNSSIPVNSDRWFGQESGICTAIPGESKETILPFESTTPIWRLSPGM